MESSGCRREGEAPMRVRRICVDGAVAQAADTAALMRKMEWQ
jgi:hypothetical protein